jgi:hypothetical protein
MIYPFKPPFLGGFPLICGFSDNSKIIIVFNKIHPAFPTSCSASAFPKKTLHRRWLQELKRRFPRAWIHSSWKKHATAPWRRMENCVHLYGDSPTIWWENCDIFMWDLRELVEFSSFVKALRFTFEWLNILKMTVYIWVKRDKQNIPCWIADITCLLSHLFALRTQLGMIINFVGGPVRHFSHWALFVSPWISGCYTL